jgi:hypothetical protein
MQLLENYRAHQGTESRLVVLHRIFPNPRNDRGQHRIGSAQVSKRSFGGFD